MKHSKPLKILYHHRTASMDGMSVHITEMVHAFEELGHEVIIVGPKFTRADQFGGGSKILPLLQRIIPRSIYELLEYAYSWRAYLKLKAAYNKHKPDILYERYNLFLSAGRWLKEKTGIPYLVEVNAPLSDERSRYGELALRSLAEKVELAVWESADMNFPVSQALANILMARGVSEDILMPVHNGIDPRHFYEQSKNKGIVEELGLQDKTVLGFIGFVREWHGINHVIEEMALHGEQLNLHLLVIGEGPAIESCKTLAEILGVADRVSFVGFKERGEINTYLSVIDIALQPAVTTYASPLKMFEYMAAGTAIVAPDQANIREILTDGEDALLFEPGNHHAMADAIIKLCNDPALKDRLAAQAKERLRFDKRTWKGNAEMITDLAHEMLDKP